MVTLSELSDKAYHILGERYIEMLSDILLLGEGEYINCSWKNLPSHENKKFLIIRVK